MPLRTRPVSSPELYCITDARLSNLSHEEQVARMLDGGARLIQLRDKSMTDAQFTITAQRCLAIAHWSDAMLVINDRVQIAAAIRADGLHLGQDDMPPAQARRIVGDDMVVGLSTHNREQFLRALDEPVDYIAFGPVYGTSTKDNPDPTTGLDFIPEAVRLLANDHRPLVLIGGINLENIPAISALAPRAFHAVISAIVARGNSIPARVRAFRKAIGAV